MKTTLFSRPLKALFLVALLSCPTVKGWCADPLSDYLVFSPKALTAGTVTESWLRLAASGKTVGSTTSDKVHSVIVYLYIPNGWTCGTSIQSYGDICKWDYDFDEQGTSTHFAGSGSKQSESAIEGYTKYHFLVYSSDTKPTHGSGDMFSVKIKAPSATAAGAYPIYLEGYFTYDSNDEHNIDFGRICSYVTVGTPTDASLALEEVVPEEVTDAMTAQTGVTFDVTDVKALAPFASSANVTYTKEIPAGTWGTICPPHDPLSDANIQYYSAVSTGSGYVKVPVGVVKGGTPAIYHAYNDTEVTLENKWNNSGFNFGEQGTGLVGVNTIATVAANSGYFINASTGEFEVNTADKDVTAFDAYFNTEVSTLPTALQVTDAGYATFHSTVSDYVLPDGAEAFIVKNVGSGDSQKSVYLMSCGKNIAKGTAVIVKAAEGLYNLTVPGSALTAPSGNKLEGGITIPNAKAYYSLESANTFKRFYTGSSQSTPDNDAIPLYNKAYLPE